MINTVELGSVAEVFNGKTPARDEQRETGFPVLKIRDVDESGRFKGTFESFVEQTFANKFQDRWIARKDILILNAAHNADYVASKIYLAEDCVAGSLGTGEWLFVRAKKAEASYLYHFLRTSRATLALRDFVKGIHLYPKDVSRLKIPLPTLDEQRRIAAILDQADDLRRKRQGALNRLNAFATAIFVGMFGDPRRSSSRWPSKELGLLSTFENGDRSSNYPSGNDIRSEGIPFLSTRNIVDDKLDLVSLNYISREKFASLSRGKARPNDLIITLRGTLGSCCIFDGAFDNAFINAQMMIIRVGPELLPSFLHKYITLPALKMHLLQLGNGAAVQQLTAGQLSKLQVPIPPIDLQRTFAARVAEIDKLKAAHRAHLTKLDALFASLQHRAFRGEL